MIKNKLYILFFTILTSVFLVMFIYVNNLKVETNDSRELKPKIVLLSHVYKNPYWSYVKKGAEDAAKKRGAVIEYNGPQTASVKEGTKLIDMALEARVQGIITYVQDEDEYVPYINKAMEKGIPVVTVDSDAPKSQRISYVGTNNTKAGVIGARQLVRKMGTRGNVGIIMGGKDVKNQIERVKGFTKYINKNTQIKISSIESSGSYQLEAKIAAQKILMSNEKVDALFCTSALDGVGAAEAVKELKLKDKVIIICFDDLPETIGNIKDGIVYAAIIQNPYEIGYNSVNIILDNLQGKKVKAAYFTDTDVLKKENLSRHITGQGDK